MSLLEKLHEKVLHSEIQESLTLLNKVWENEPDSSEILASLHPISLFGFSHRFPSIHIPKEHEYLFRLLKHIPKKEQIDFLNRFVEYLAWAPKYVNDETNTFPSSGEDRSRDYKQEYLFSMEAHKGLAALFSALKFAEGVSLEKTFRTILQVGCNDVSQAIGHYFSCTESVIRLGLDAGMPKGKNHIFLLTQYLMQSSPIVMTNYQKPTQSLKEILAKLVKKGGFAGYHFMILANGLIKNREFLGEKHYLHALQGLEMILPQLDDKLTTEKLDSMVVNGGRSRDSLKGLKKHIWKGEKLKAFAMLRQFLDEEGVTQELTATIAHTYTRIDDHPHDPHYVTFPVSVFELVPRLKDEEVELVLAHSVEFAVDRVRRYGVMRAHC
jgi:hypothetical protein